MKFVFSLVSIFWLLLLLLATGCKENESPAPLMQAELVGQAVFGKWSVEKVTFQLCRDRNCSASTYTGNANDYFEFRADSAFLVLSGMPQKQREGCFKASYNLHGKFVLTQGEWSAGFELKEVKPGRLVLKSSFTGRDPNAIFTDTYYLHR